MKTNLLNKIAALIAATEYIEIATCELHRLFVKACKASDSDMWEVENLLDKVVEINGLEA